MEAAGDGTLSPVALIDEVTEMFQSSNDAEVTRQIREMGDEIIVECDQQQKHLKELIQRMSQDVVEQSKGVQESCPENDAAIAALKEKHENAARVAEGWKKKHAYDPIPLHTETRSRCPLQRLIQWQGGR